MTQVIPLGGPEAKRYFAPAAETTARQDGWIMVQVNDAGILKFVGKDLDESTAFALISEVYRTGKWEYLLAGLLVEQGVKWTPATAEKNAEWFAELTDADSKKLLQTNFISLLAGFFLNAMPSSAPFPSVLGTTTAPLTTNGDAPSTAPEALELAAVGSPVPESLPKVTRNGLAKSSTGRSKTSSTRSGRGSARSRGNSTTPN